MRWQFAGAALVRYQVQLRPGQAHQSLQLRHLLAASAGYFRTVSGSLGEDVVTRVAQSDGRHGFSIIKHSGNPIGIGAIQSWWL